MPPQKQKNKKNTDVVDVRLVEISKKSLKDLKQGGDSAGSSWFSNLFKGIGAVVGIAALGTAIYYIIKSIGGMPSVDTNTILLVAGGILAFVGILYGLTKIGWGTLLKGLIALGGIAAILNFLIAPAMVLLSSVNWEDALGAVVAAGLAITGLAVLAEGIGKIVTTGRGALGMLAGLASIAAIAALIQYLIAPAMMEISKVQWDAALAGIEIAGIAITALAVLAGAIGALIVGSGGVGALAAGAGNVMFGSWLAGTYESAADTLRDPDGRLYKENFGMASNRAVRNRMRREGLFDRASKELFEEGISTSRMYLDPERPGVEDIIDQIVAGVRSSFTYAGANTNEEFHQRATVGIQSSTGYDEGRPVGTSW